MSEVNHIEAETPAPSLDTAVFIPSGFIVLIAGISLVAFP